MVDTGIPAGVTFFRAEMVAGQPLMRSVVFHIEYTADDGTRRWIVAPPGLPNKAYSIPAGAAYASAETAYLQMCEPRAAAQLRAAEKRSLALRHELMQAEAEVWAHSIKANIRFAATKLFVPGPLPFDTSDGLPAALLKRVGGQAYRTFAPGDERLSYSDVDHIAMRHLRNYQRCIWEPLVYGKLPDNWRGAVWMPKGPQRRSGNLLVHVTGPKGDVLWLPGLKAL